jgi:hypothetical protein
MITEQQAALLAQPNTAVPGINRAKGAPQLSVVFQSIWCIHRKFVIIAV